MQEIVRLEKIVKVYPNGVVANKHVDFSINKGEIHALVGENGTGKSTLMKILFGIEQPTEGNIVVKGETIKLSSPMDAIAKGIGMVHQHFMLVPSLTVAENIVLGSEPTKGLFINFEKAVEMTTELIKQYHFDIDPRAKIEDLTVGTKQKVEILKALFRGAQILILDEPTAVLTPQETTELFKELDLLKEKGHTIIFISHKLNEIKEICDRVTIMRKGRNVGVFNVSDVSKQEISNLMVGKELSWDLNQTKAEPKESIVKVKKLKVYDSNQKMRLKDVSFSVRSGEILGIVGVEGNGQLEVVESITGLHKYEGGEVQISGQDISELSIKQIRDIGTSHIPEDRMTLGVAKMATIEENLMSTYLDEDEFKKGIFLNMKKINEWARNKVSEFIVKTDSEKTMVKMLSGGNIQKVVVAREFSNNPKFIVADQPTRGIDIGAAKFIHKKLIELRDKGSAVLLVSADLTEVMDLSDSLMVMYGGEIVAYFEDASQVDEMQLGRYMLGIERQTPEEIGRCVYE